MAADRARVHSPASAQLRDLAELRHREPATVRDRTEAILDRSDLTVAETAMARWVLGLALHELGQAADAVVSYRESATSAALAADDDVESRARASMAISLLSLGDSAAALREVNRARDQAPPTARGLVEMLAALVLQRTGRLDDALAGYGRALPLLRRDGDDANSARLLVNRGTLFAYQGAFSDALTDLAEAERLASALELWMLVAMAADNLGFTEGRRGQIPHALAAFDRAAAAYGSLGGSPRLVAGLASDRCEVLLAAGLTTDARQAARDALDLLGDAGDAAQLSESRLLHARACLADGDLEEAQFEAARAAEEFRAARRPPWAAVAEYVAMQAEVLAFQDQAGPPEVAMLRRTSRITRLLEQQGWPVEALHVRTFHARVALALGRPQVAREVLAEVVRSRVRGPADLRAQAWHASALIKLADGERSDAKRALRRGLAVLDEHRAGLAATELRAGVAAQGIELARLGLRLAMADGRPWEVLRWAERGRAGALRLPPVTPPEDRELTAALEALREARSARRDAALAGGLPEPGEDRRIARLESVVRARTLQVDGAATTSGGRVLDQRGLVEALGDATLVELFRVDDVLHAVTVVDGRPSLRRVSSVAAVAEEQQYLLFALRRVLAIGGTTPSAADVAAVGAAALALDRLLFADSELREPDVGEERRPVVVVPTGTLHGMPWSLLPSLTGRAITVAPSAEVWRGRARGVAAVSGARVTLVAGPDLPGADDEVDQLAERYPGATVLRGAEGTVDAVLAAMARSDLVHLAAHGAFRADSPLFSSLRLADGDLTVYELERLRATPSTVVFAACDAARHRVSTGDELIGTAAAMIGLGVRSVIVPTMPVPDAATTAVMVALHERLAAGRAPSEALADVVRSTVGQRQAAAVAAAFVCIGAAERTPVGPPEGG